MRRACSASRWLFRFEPGELDDYPDAFDHPPRRIGEDEPLFVLGP
jgi:hypothetical protein